MIGRGLSICEKRIDSTFLIVHKKKTMTFKLTHDNYNATLIKVDKLHDLPNLDKLKAIQYAGFSALVD